MFVHLMFPKWFKIEIYKINTSMFGERDDVSSVFFSQVKGANETF